jgi:glucokinase
MARTVLGVDVGGTKIAVGIVDENGRLLTSASRQTPAGDQESIFAAVREAIEEATDGARVEAVGIASPGPVDLTTGRVSPINIPGWHDFPLRERITGLLPGAVATLAGDGVCMALGEHWAGAGRGSGAMLGMVVSTGVGGGLVLDGRPFAGRTGNAAHVGHVVVEPDGEPCTCGGRGCVETVASGPNLVRWARLQGWQAPEHADAAHLAAAARAGDELPVAAFHRAGWAVGLAIAAAAAITDLELAVIGGGVAQAGNVLFEPIRTTLAEYARLSFLDGLRAVPATLGREAGMIGAAALAFRAA